MPEERDAGSGKVLEFAMIFSEYFFVKTGNLAAAIQRNTAGSIMPLAAVGFVVLAALVGGGLDLSRAYKAKIRLQSACDAGVLAGRKSVSNNGFDQTALSVANRYFESNLEFASQDILSVRFMPRSIDSGNTVAASAEAGVKTLIMQLFGYETMKVSVSCSASMGVGNSDVTMVLDTTGSMGWALEAGGPTKLSMLQNAMMDFYDTVAASVAGGNTRVRYAFIPYSSTVNVGRLLFAESPDYLVDFTTIQSREPVYGTVDEETFDHWANPISTTAAGESSEWIESEGVHNSTEFLSRSQCIATLPSNTAWINNAGPTSASNTVTNVQGQRVVTITQTRRQLRTAYTCVQRQRGTGRNKVTFYVVYSTSFMRDRYEYVYETSDPIYVTEATTTFDHYVYKPVVYDVRAFKSFASVTTRTGDSGNSIASSWDGCIEERDTTPAASFNFSQAIGIAPLSAKDLDIDAAPGSSDDGTKWRPMWPEVAFYRTSFVNIGRGRGRYDLANNSESLTGGQAPSSCPQQAKTLQVLTRGAFSSYANSLVASGNTYHDIGLLWGARLSSTTGIFSNSVNLPPTNGGNVSRHLIFMTDGQMQPSNAIQSAYGIEFHDRRVTANGVNLQTERHSARFLVLCEAVKSRGIRLWVIAFSTDLSDDLADCASDNSAFLADDATQLNAAFREIANEVGELRIVQ
jgi:Flp pilus assembly protein TadG